MTTTRTETVVRTYDEDNKLISETTHSSVTVTPDAPETTNPTGLYL